MSRRCSKRHTSVSVSSGVAPSHTLRGNGAEASTILGGGPDVVRTVGSVTSGPRNTSPSASGGDLRGGRNAHGWDNARPALPRPRDEYVQMGHRCRVQFSRRSP
jgi:hypothetical protein